MKSPRRLTLFRKNINIVNPATSGAGPTKSQNTGWLVSAAAMVPRSRSVKLKLKVLMSFPVRPDRFRGVAGLFKARRERVNSVEGADRLAIRG